MHKIQSWDYYEIVQKCADEVGIPTDTAMQFIDVLVRAADRGSSPIKNGTPVIHPQPKRIM